MRRRIVGAVVTIILTGCSYPQQQTAVLAVFRPDKLAELRCYDRGAGWLWDGRGCFFVPSPAPAAGSGPALPNTPYAAYLTGGHDGPQRFSGEYMEKATGASPFFTHGR